LNHSFAKTGSLSKEKSKKEQNRHPRRKENYETANAVLMLQVRTLEASNGKNEKNTKSATVPPREGCGLSQGFLFTGAML
jgi:hypothetical protein